MTAGYVQVATDGSGKQLGNEVVLIPAGSVISDGAGNLTTLSSPQYWFREHIINADPSDPKGIASVRNADGPGVNDYGLTVRLPFGQADLQTLIAQVQDMAADIKAMAAPWLAGPFVAGETALPVVGMPPGILSPTVPRGLICDQFGRQLIVPHATREAVTTVNITITNNTANTLIAAGDTRTFNDLVAVIAANTSATAVRLDISDGTQTLPLYLPAGDTRGISLGGVLIKATNTNTAWTATSSTSVTDVRVWALYVSNKAQ